MDTGFEPRQGLNFQLVLPGDYRPTEKLAVAHELATRIVSLPRVEAAGFTDAPPLAGGILLAPFVPPGMTDAAWNSGPMRERPALRSE